MLTSSGWKGNKRIGRNKLYGKVYRKVNSLKKRKRKIFEER